MDAEHCSRKPVVCRGCQKADARLCDRPSYSEEDFELRESRSLYKRFSDTQKNDIEDEKTYGIGTLFFAALNADSE